MHTALTINYPAFHPADFTQSGKKTRERAWRAFLKRPENFTGPKSHSSVKLRPAYFVKLVFSYVVKGIEIKITAKFRGTEHLRFEDTKRIMSLENFRDDSGKW